MAIKIEIIGSAIVCTNTITSDIIISQPSKDIWYKEDDLTTLNRISLYDANGINGSSIHSKEIPTIQISDAVNSDLTPFAVASFREWATNFLGFDASQSKGSETTPPITESGNIAPGSNVYADATTGVINLALPFVANNNNVSVNIKKIDASANKVIISAQAGELVEFASSVELVLKGESFTIISNGIEWYVI